MLTRCIPSQVCLNFQLELNPSPQCSLGTVPAQVCLVALAWANCQDLDASAVPYLLNTKTCPAVELNATGVYAPEYNSQCLVSPIMAIIVFDTETG